MARTLDYARPRQPPRPPLPQRIKASLPPETRAKIAALTACISIVFAGLLIEFDNPFVDTEPVYRFITGHPRPHVSDKVSDPSGSHYIPEDPRAIDAASPQ